MGVKSALVTGASEGIGRAFAVALAAQGYTLVLVARNEAALTSLATQLRGDGHVCLAADLATPEGVTAVCDRLQSTPVQLLINNAGVGLVGGFCQPAIEQHLALVRLNIEALTRLSFAFCAQAKAGDALINVSSVLAAAPQPAQPVYAATKAFVTSLSESLWYEMGARKVLVMALQPGATLTRFHTHAGRPATWQRPGWLSQTPEAVVACALAALQSHRGPTVTSGAGNRLFVWAAKRLPRQWLVKLMARTS